MQPAGAKVRPNLAGSRHPMAGIQGRDAIEIDKIPLETWPRRNESDPLADDTWSIEFLLTAAEWSRHGERVRSVTQEVYRGWESGGQEDDSK